MATMPPLAAQSFDGVAFFLGRHPARTSSMPSCGRWHWPRFLTVAGQHDDAQAVRRRSASAAAASGFTVSARSSNPASFPSMATHMQAWPSAPSFVRLGSEGVGRDARRLQVRLVSG
jgi:hypothetical protein